jgi:chromosomal replication initiation ATPase DnaA
MEAERSMKLTEEHRANYAPEFLARVAAKHSAMGRLKQAAKPKVKPAENVVQDALDRHGAARQVMRDNGMPDWVRQIVFSVAEANEVSAAKIMLKEQSRVAVRARNEALYRVKEAKPDLSLPKIGGWFGMDHTTVMYALARHAEATGDCPLTDYNLDKAMRARRAANRKARLQNQSEA